MNKIKIVFLREFLTRIKSKGFILSTLLAPLGLAVVIGTSIFATMSSMEDDTKREIAVVDETGKLATSIELLSNVSLKPTTESAAVLRKKVLAEALDGYLILPASLLEGKGSVQYFSRGNGGFALQIQLQKSIEEAVRIQRLQAKGVTGEVQSILNQRTNLEMQTITAQGAKADDTGFYTGLAFAMAMFIYMMMFIYGSIVMQSVMEEKSSRVLEIMASSVRPFDMMMGKVLGMGALGLLQMTAWIVLSMTMMTMLGSITTLFLNPTTMNLPDVASQQQMLNATGFAIPDLKISLFFYFLLYFLGGYLLYSSYFTAVGSAVESPQDAQQMMLPITFLIIIPMLLIQSIIGNPDSTLSVILTQIPFFSPMLMPARIAVTDVPLWQIALSLLLLVGGFLATIWVSARIYRIGILMYGKKPSFKDLLKWIKTA